MKDRRGEAGLIGVPNVSFGRRLPARTFLPFFSTRTVRLSQIDFRSDCHFYSASSARPSTTKERLVCASRAEGRKAGGTHLPLSLSLSRPYSRSVGRLVGLLISGQRRLPGMNHRSCVRTCVWIFVSRARARIYDRHAKSSGYSCSGFSCRLKVL